MLKDDDSIGEAFIVAALAALMLVGVLVLMIPAYILHGWVVTILWAWFVVPIFHLPQISIPVAIGLEMLLIMLRPIQCKTDDKAWKAVVAAYVAPFVTLGVAYVAHSYI